MQHRNATTIERPLGILHGEKWRLTLDTEIAKRALKAAVAMAIVRNAADKDAHKRLDQLSTVLAHEIMDCVEGPARELIADYRMSRLVLTDPNNIIVRMSHGSVELVVKVGGNLIKQEDVARIHIQSLHIKPEQK